jgi:hypothetical protein
MKRITIKQLGTGLLGLAVMSGCNHYRSQRQPAAMSMAHAQAFPSTYNRQMMVASQPAAATSSAPTGTSDSTQTSPAAMPVGTADAGTNEVTPASHSETQAGASSDSGAGGVENHTGFPRGELEPQRRSFVDVTAAPCFGHADDYTWLSGQLEYSRLSMAWRLRYASVDEVDRFGGSVTLIENGDLRKLKDGQYVMVRGHLNNPADAGTAPSYRIESLQVIENPNQQPMPAFSK